MADETNAHGTPAVRTQMGAATGLGAGSRPRVLVLMGGPDAEREVSLMSGAEVARALASTGEFEVVPLTIMRATAEDLLAHRPDAIYPILHGPWGEGGPLQAILEQIAANHGIGFVGPRSKPASIAMDKLATKFLASGAGVRTPRARQVRAGETLDLQAPIVIALSAMLNTGQTRKSIKSITWP